MEIHQLRYFVKTAELGNFTKAAEACHVSQPSLSQQIIKLEEELGQPLIERLGRGIRLTPAGEKFKEYADRILNLLDEAKSQLHDGETTGILRLTAIPTIGPYWVPERLRQFLAEHPEAQVEFGEDVTEEAIRKLHHGELDVAILAMPIDDADLGVKHLFEEELLVVLRSDHPLASREAIGMEELARERFVLLHDAHCLSQTTLRFCRRKAFTPIVTARVHQAQTVLELVALGQGISIVPAMVAAKDNDPRRVYRSLAGEKLTREVVLAYGKHRYRTGLSRRFERWLSGG